MKKIGALRRATQNANSFNFPSCFAIAGCRGCTRKGDCHFLARIDQVKASGQVQGTKTDIAQANA